MSASTAPAHSTRLHLRRRIAAVVAVLIGLMVAPFGAGTAAAHTGFESSTPSDGSTADAPVELVTIVFTGDANPVGDKFIALTPQGVLQAPVSIETIDNRLFSVRFDPPLAGGQVGVRWNVQAADAHPIEGAFSFTVNAPAPTTVPPTVPTTVPAAVPATTQVTVPATTSTVVAAVSDAPIDGDDEASTSAAVVGDDAVPSGAGDETTATAGRVVGFLGVTLGLGALAFAATALRGRRDEVRQALRWIRVLGVVIAVGAAIEYVGVGRIGGQTLVSNWSTAPGFATILRIFGGIGLSVGLAGTISRGPARGVARQPSTARSLSAAVADDLTVATPRHAAGSPVVRWVPDARSWPALGGVVLILASFWFDGHTVSKGFRPFHALVNTVHVAAGAVWVGGVVTLAAVVWSRYRHHEPMRIVELVVRFSKIATIALASVVAAGGIMAILVLDSFGELTGTPWGKILLLKTAAVGLAMIGGAYNHFRLLPALESDPESPELRAALRSTVTAEAILLVFVVTVTAWLVSAAS